MTDAAAASAEVVERVKAVAAGIRRRVALHTYVHKGGYLCQACSSAETLASLYCGGVLRIGGVPDGRALVPGKFDPATKETASGAEYNGEKSPDRDRFILSPSQYSLVLYAALVEAGRMAEEGLAMFNQDGGVVEMIGAAHSPGMELMTGSLGQGISQAAGIAMARRLKGEKGRVVVFMSDGEFQVGQTWEAVQAMAHHGLGNVLVYVDVNGYQCDGSTEKVCNIEPLDKRLEAFNAVVRRIDGHDIPALIKAGEGDGAGKNPVFVLCNTCPWRDLPFLQKRAPKFHYVRFSSEQERADFRSQCEASLGTFSVAPASAPQQQQPNSNMCSRPFGKTLINWAKDRPRVVALSADLTSSVELDTFRGTYPDRFFSMGIAEQNMCSWAGGLAREGFLPLVCTFAVFIYRRAFDQVCMSIAYPNLKVVLCGFLPGITTPGGATHQATEDVAVMRALPNMTVLECGDATDCESVLDVAESVNGPVYIRVLRGDVPRLFDSSEPMVLGKARMLVAPSAGRSTNVLVISSGICTEEALRLFRALQRGTAVDTHGLSLVHVSTLKPFNDPNVIEAIRSAKVGIVTIENHNVVGGLGSIVAECMASLGVSCKLVKLGLQDTFAHGASRGYLMKEYGLDSVALMHAVEGLVGSSLGITAADLGAVRVDLVHSLSKAEAL